MISRLPGVGRFCLTMKYGRHFLRGEEWHIDTGQGLRNTRPPPEAQRTRVDGPGPPRRGAGPAHRGEARRSRVPLLWDLERFTALLAGAETEARSRQPLGRPRALEEISALMNNSAHARVESSRSG